MCEYCEQAKTLKKEIDRNIKEFNFIVGETLVIGDLKKFHFNAAVEIKSQLSYSSEESKLLYDKHKSSLEILNDYEQILFHQNVNKLQRACYNENHKSIHTMTNKVLIELDYKQRIKIGMSPRQVGQEYYEQESRSCLGKS